MKKRYDILPESWRGWIDQADLANSDLAEICAVAAASELVFYWSDYLRDLPLEEKIRIIDGDVDELIGHLKRWRSNLLQGIKDRRIL